MQVSGGAGVRVFSGLGTLGQPQEPACVHAWLFLRHTNTVGACALRMEAAYLSEKCVYTQQACVLTGGCGGCAGRDDPSNRMLLES